MKWRMNKRIYGLDATVSRIVRIMLAMDHYVIEVQHTSSHISMCNELNVTVI